MGRVKSSGGDPPEWWVPLLLAGLTPVVTTLGVIAAEELRKLQQRGWRLW